MKKYEVVLKSILDGVSLTHDAGTDIVSEPGGEGQDLQLCFNVYSDDEIEVTYGYLVSNFDYHFIYGGQKAPYREIILVVKQQLNGAEFRTFWWAEIDYDDPAQVFKRVKSGVYKVGGVGADREATPQEEADLMQPLQPIGVGFKLREGSHGYRRYKCRDDRYQSFCDDIEAIRVYCFGEQEHGSYYWESVEPFCAA